jgi:cardiolipin synthase
VIIFNIGDGMSPKAKVIIPNILTLIRLIVSPIIIFLCIAKNYKVALILVVIACITDLFDGKLARKWNTVTDLGAKLDAGCDKAFGMCLTICLITKFNFFIPVLILEGLIGLFNLIVFLKTKLHSTLMIGKIKTTFLYVTFSIGFFGFFNKIDNIILGFVLMTINIQVLTLISYILSAYDEYKNNKIEQAIVNDKTDTRVKIFDIEEVEKKEEKEFSSDTKVLNQIKDIFLDEE